MSVDEDVKPKSFFRQRLRYFSIACLFFAAMYGISFAMYKYRLHSDVQRFLQTGDPALADSLAHELGQGCFSQSEGQALFEKLTETTVEVEKQYPLGKSARVIVKHAFSFAFGDAELFQSVSVLDATNDTSSSSSTGNAIRTPHYNLNVNLRPTPGIQSARLGYEYKLTVYEDASITETRLDKETGGIVQSTTSKRGAVKAVYKSKFEFPITLKVVPSDGQ